MFLCVNPSQLDYLYHHAVKIRTCNQEAVSGLHVQPINHSAIQATFIVLHERQMEPDANPKNMMQTNYARCVSNSIQNPYSSYLINLDMLKLAL